MLRTNRYIILRSLQLTVLVGLTAIRGSAQSPFFTAAAPSAVSGTGNTLSVSLPVTNSSAVTASNVEILSVQLSTTVPVSPSTFPVPIGEVPAESTFPVNVTFNSSKLVVGAKYLLTVRGNYSFAGNTLAFAVNRYVTIPSAQSVISGGTQVVIPPGFQIDLATLSLAGPISLNNFASLYPEGGTLPPGGVVIDITSVVLPHGSLSDFIASELAGATITSTDAITVAGTSATRVAYSDSYSSFLILKEIAVYVPHGTQLYKIYLSYRAGDPSESMFLASFQQILTSVQFKS